MGYDTSKELTQLFTWNYVDADTGEVLATETTLQYLEWDGVRWIIVREVPQPKDSG